MASINYLSGTVIPSTWLNDVDAVVWDIFGGASTVLGARSALGLGTADSPAFAGADIGDMGTEGSGINIGGTVYNSTFKVSDIDGTNYAQTILHRHSTTLEPLIVSARSNSNTSAHADMAAGQSVFSIYGTGWAGSNYKIFSSVELGVDATGTISNTSSPGRITFKVTPDGSTTPATALSIANNKSVTFAGLQTLAAGADIASATTVDLTAATGNLVRITGTTATTGVTINNGQVVLCYPTGAWPLTYHATNMPIKGGASYTCEAGDTVIFSKDGNGTLHVDIVPVALHPAIVAQATAEAGTDTTARLWTAQRVAQAIAANNSTAETAWTDYSATSTIVGWSSFTTKLIYYKDIGKTRFVSFYLAGTSNSTSTNFTVPNASSNTVPVTSIARAQNNGVEEATGLVNLGANSAQVDCYRTLLASWTSSGTKLSAGQFTYQLP